MVRLRKFYDLVSRNAHIVLVNAGSATECYKGDLHRIPDEYDDREVVDFSMQYDGTIIFQLKEI